VEEYQDKPNFLVYVAYLGVYVVALNTVYLILPNEQLRWYLVGLLVVAVMSGFILSARHYITIGIMLDIAGLAVFIYYAYRIYLGWMAFGTYMGEMLAVMLVLRCFKLFRHQDFLPPLVISLTLMVFSAIPSFSAEYVYSLVGFILMLGLALFMASIDEFARLPRRRARRSRWEYTYDFLEDYAPVPTSRRTPGQLLRFLSPAAGATVPAALVAFLISSAFYFTVDHSRTPGVESTFLTAFSDIGFETDPAREAAMLTGVGAGTYARHYTGFDTEFDIAQGRLIENSTSTQTVMEVESNLPSYWRGKCFDTYTGRGWVQSEYTASATWSLDPPAGRRAEYHGEIGRALNDAGIRADPQIYKDEIRQKYRLMTDLPGILFTAYQPMVITLPVPAVVIDDTFSIYSPHAADSMVAGQEYEVVSRKHAFGHGDYLSAYDYNPADLRNDDPEFYARYTQLPERGTLEDPDSGFNFTRVRAKAYEITAGLDTVYARVRALERFLESQYNFSLNPPSAVPPEKDAIDFFLFDWESRRGHCEYFSTALAVLCRSIGIPSRVVTGYTTGGYNLLKNAYIVQERHAHAWVEMFWPEIGWVEFDPTPLGWYQGIGEKAAGGWLVFHNTMENLYVYDPRGQFREKVFPACFRAIAWSRHFLRQRELDFYEFVEPAIISTEKEREGSLWLLAGAFSLLLTSFVLRRLLEPKRIRKEAVRVGGKCLLRVRRGLIGRGIDPDLLATETDCALKAASLSERWGTAVGDLVEAYQSARYSGRKVTGKDLAAVRRSCRTASRIPRLL